MTLPSQVLTSWIFQTRAHSCLLPHWRSCSCFQLSSTPTTQLAPLQVNKQTHFSFYDLDSNLTQCRINLISFFSPALQLFNMSTHNWLRNAESKENFHGRASATSGESRPCGLSTTSEIFQNVKKIKLRLQHRKMNNFPRAAVNRRW